jgi:phage terminase large subunit GpA-like protein
MSKSIPRHIQSFFDALKPPPDLTVSAWADQHRFLTSETSAEPGRWRTDRTPYLRAIMEALSDTDPCTEVVFMKGAQIGGTEIGINWIGHTMHVSPCPMMAVQPTVETSEDWSRDRITPLIVGTPIISAMFGDSTNKNPNNTISRKKFPGGYLKITGANSAAALRSKPIKRLMLDEVDGYPLDVDGEGDPVALAVTRTRTFARRKIYYCSTPTFASNSRIEELLSKSDRCYYLVPCIHCGHEQRLRFEQLRWEKGHPEGTAYHCELCDGQWKEHNKTDLLAKGRWAASQEGAPGMRGFHVSSLYSPAGWLSWVDCARKFEEAQSSGNSQKMKAFVNTILGETWQEKGESPEWRRLYDRREDYQPGTVPDGVHILTAGADVQKDRIEMEVVGWAPGMRSWSVAYHIIEGDVFTPEPWQKLSAILDTAYPQGTGKGNLKVQKLCIDTGYATQQVYGWGRKQNLGVVAMIKGVDGLASIIGKRSNVDVTENGRKIGNGAVIWTVGSSVAKAELYGWLRLEAPLEGDDPPGYCRFPEYATEYFEQLTAEQMVIRTVRGYQVYQWEKTRDRNEALDCRVYARAAASIMGLDRLDDKHWPALAGRKLTSQSESRNVSERTTTSDAAGRSRRRSSYY